MFRFGRSVSEMLSPNPTGERGAGRDGECGKNENHFPLGKQSGGRKYFCSFYYFIKSLIESGAGLSVDRKVKAGKLLRMISSNYWPDWRPGEKIGTLEVYKV